MLNKQELCAILCMTRAARALEIACESGKQKLYLLIKGDLDGAIFSYDCRMRFLERALLASCKNRTQLSPLNIAFTYDCRRILKHVLKSYDIFRVGCVCRKDVVG